MKSTVEDALSPVPATSQVVATAMNEESAPSLSIIATSMAEVEDPSLAI